MHAIASQSTTSTAAHTATRPATAVRQGNRTVVRLGFWSAVLTSVLSAAWLVAQFTQPLIAPLPEWTGTAASVGAFDALHMLPLIPSLPLVVAFVVLLACLYLYAPADGKAYALGALSIGLIYAAMATINYNIQLVSVRTSLQAGETAGLEMFLLANPHSLTMALANSYVYMSLAMLFAGLVFRGARLANWTRWLLVAAGLAAPLQLAWTMFDVPIAGLLSVVPWALGAVVGSALVAVIFRRAGRIPTDSDAFAGAEGR